MGEPTAKTAKSLKDHRADPPDGTVNGASRAAAEPSAAPSVAESLRSPRLMLARLRTPRTPRLWFELLLIGFSYWLYSQIRNAVPAERGVALRHAADVWSLERDLGLGVEHSINHALNSVTWLIVGMNYYYASLHFVITIGVLVWLYVAHPHRYAAPRLVLFATTWLALIGFWAYPLAPPRLMPGGGFIDTVAVHHTWGSLSQGSLAHVSNQYAAMPSMHIGWSLWCGITIFNLARPLWVRLLGLLYPVFTLTVILATGNHFWLDAVGGVICLAAGYGLVYLLYGRWAYHLPKTKAQKTKAQPQPS
ncbi:PAP2 superfamily protein [Actinacidiphila yanglinensis]|uniref:PAP2 superfamily protein n=1 Tax=Actinacidiphila yanglinensis TaxID=310779 RepID=A0A1H5T5N8_9ACTN|nr:phosphatase PAP2 family protein [Actinacidiphila yanglinensis]SEF58182.1 PAP2 superfamily protein [Actinacidiphila yanglinensis]